jgi:DNA-binding protein HU-beta
MNKSELIEALAEATDTTKSSAGRSIEALVDIITAMAKEGDSLALPGFGTFSVKERAARAGRNPQTGEAIQIKASRALSFKQGKAVKDALAI